MVIQTLRSTAYRGITGKVISTALKKLPEKMSWHCEIGISENSYEFVPRVSERHPREEISLLFSKNGTQYLIAIVPLNPKLRYREIIFSVQQYNRLAAGKWEEITFEHVGDSEIKDFEILCAEIVEKLLREIQHMT